MSEKPYGANEDMEDWAARRGVKFSPRARCLHWISKGRCGVRSCEDGHGSRDWMDHVSGWTKNGERLLLCQPYAFTDVSTLAAACERFSLRALIHGNGWYGHGTVAIELTPRVESD